MGSSVAVVTDSTSYLPPGLAERHALTIVPMQIAIGGAVRDEGEITAAEAAQALKEWHPVTTSRPSPERFAQAFKEAAGAGATTIVSIHLSSSMSGTIEAATLAAEDSPVPVKVIDSGTIGMGLGLAALSAAALALQGADGATVADAALQRARSSRSLFYVDTLEHLRRGGRIGAAATLLGSALMVKPLLNIVDGKIAPLEKVRTSSRALSRLEELAVAEAADRRVDLAVQHVAAAPRAEALAERLRERIPNVDDIYLGEAGPVISAHVGPGMIGVVVAPQLG